MQANTVHMGWSSHLTLPMSKSYVRQANVCKASQIIGAATQEVYAPLAGKVGFKGTTMTSRLPFLTSAYTVQMWPNTLQHSSGYMFQPSSSKACP